MKIMAIVDRHGLPLSVSTHAANHREVRLVQLAEDGDQALVEPVKLLFPSQTTSSSIVLQISSNQIPHNGDEVMETRVCVRISDVVSSDRASSPRLLRHILESNVTGIAPNIPSLSRYARYVTLGHHGKNALTHCN